MADQIVQGAFGAVRYRDMGDRTYALVGASGGAGATAVQVAKKELTFTGAELAGNDPDPATGVFTSDNTNFADGEQVTIGNKTYTFKTALTPTEGEVLIGADADASLTNLKNAINHTGTPDTDYSCAAAHTQVSSSAVAAHAITLTALVEGTAGNSIATTETCAHASFGAATLTGGTAGATTPLFTIAGDVFATAVVVCRTSLAGASATFEIGTVESTNLLIPTTTATSIVKNDVVDKGGEVTSGTAPATTPVFPLTDAQVVGLKVKTADITAGKLEIYLYYNALPGGSVTPA